MQSNFELLNSHDDKLLQYALYSILLHSILLLVFFLAGKTFSLFPSSDKLSFLVIEKSIRVDVVAMPTETLKELKNIEISTTVSKEIAKVEPVKMTVPDEDSDYLKLKKSFLSTLKDLGKRKVEEPVAKKKNDAKLSDKERGKLEGLILAGNRLSDGSSVSGKDRSATDEALSSYLMSLPESIKPRWRLPSYLRDKVLKCRVRIFLTATGELIKSEIYESSGVNEYDEKALNAVRGSSPFGPVPKEIQERALRGEILLGFPL